MKREEIIRMAREAGFRVGPSRDGPDDVWGVGVNLERFFQAAYAAGAAAEREAMMQLFTDPENQPTQHGTVTVEYMQREIADAVEREREACAEVCDTQWNGDSDTYDSAEACNECAAAIRARGQA